MTKKYVEFDPVIYPLKLWVVSGWTPDDANKCFARENGEPLDFDFNECGGCVFTSVMHKESLKYGTLAVFPNKNSMTMGVVCHEASHILDAFMDALGLERESGGGNEHLAYLMGWICSSINKARIGQGGTEFIVEL